MNVGCDAFHIIVRSIYGDSLATNVDNSTTAAPFVVGTAAGWLYQGEFVAERYVDNPAEIAPLVKRTGRTNIAGVLFLKRIVP